MPQILTYCCALLMFPLTARSASPKAPNHHAIKNFVDACLVYDEIAMQRSSHELVSNRERFVDPLIRLIGHSDSNVRWQSVAALRKIGVPAAPLFEPLMNACRDDDADVRGEAALAVASLFSARAETGEAVRRLRKDVHAVVQANAWFGQWQVSHDPVAVDALVALLAHKDWMVTQTAVRHLSHIGPPASSRVIAAAQDVTFRNRMAAIEVLGKTQDPTGETISALSVAARDEDRMVSKAAVTALGRIGEPAVGSLIQLLDASSPRLRNRAIKALCVVGRPAHSAIPELSRLLESPTTRVNAIETLGRIGGADAKLVDRLIQFLENSQADVRAAASAALGNLGATTAVLRLRDLDVGDPKDFVRQAARRALARIE